MSMRAARKLCHCGRTGRGAIRQLAASNAPRPPLPDFTRGCSRGLQLPGLSWRPPAPPVQHGHKGGVTVSLGAVRFFLLPHHLCREGGSDRRTGHPTPHIHCCWPPLLPHPPPWASANPDRWVVRDPREKKGGLPRLSRSALPARWPHARASTRHACALGLPAWQSRVPRPGAPLTPSRSFPSHAELPGFSSRTQQALSRCKPAWSFPEERREQPPWEEETTAADRYPKTTGE